MVAVAAGEGGGGVEDYHALGCCWLDQKWRGAILLLLGTGGGGGPYGSSLDPSLGLIWAAPCSPHGVLVCTSCLVVRTLVVLVVVS